MHGAEHAPAELLGGSPLDTATPPSPRLLTQGWSTLHSTVQLIWVSARALGDRRSFAPSTAPGTVVDMDLAYPPAAEEFRAEIAGWLRDNLPEG